MRKIVVHAALGLLVSIAAWAQVEANPGRPTVSTPATLTPVGYFQFESGLLNAQHSGEFSRRFGFTEVVKFAPIKRLQLLVQTEPLVRSHIDTGIDRRPGEVFLGFQGVVVPGKEHRPTVSVSYFRRAYASPAPELDIGTNRQSALLLVSFDAFGFHVDTNGIVTEQIDEPRHRAQFGQTLSISHPVARHFGVSGEIWHFTQPFLRSNAIGALFATSYNLKKNLVLDGGFNRGLTATSTHWEAFVGFTYLAPRKMW
ncbi:MAG TPA: hypothetical protein VG488_11205 [Candidatus Angelobacter sp.]|jgi:hypothetical protein|nr:hypothetical protein [Candidatus Angelobacter sp.]